MSGTLALESATAWYQIVIADAELYSEGLCGSSAECFVGGSTPAITGGKNSGAQAIITLGHTATWPEGKAPTVPKMKHEIEGHVVQYETEGAIKFGIGYGSEFAFRRYALRDPNAYDNLSYEVEAKTMEGAG